MTKLNWDRVRVEDRIRRHGSESSINPSAPVPVRRAKPPKRKASSNRAPKRLVKCDQCPALLKAKNLRKHMFQVHGKSKVLSPPPTQNSSALQRPAPAAISRKAPEMITISRLEEELRPYFHALLMDVARAQGARITSALEPVPLEIAEKIRVHFKRRA